MGWVVLSMYVAAPISFVALVVATRSLGAARFGIASIIMAFPSLLWSLLSFKPATVLTRYVSLYYEEKRLDALAAVCRVGLLLDLVPALIIATAVFFSADWIGPSLLDIRGQSWTLRLFALTFVPYALLGTSHAILAGAREFRWIGILQIAEAIASLVFVVAALLLSKSVAAVVLALGGASAFMGVISAFKASRILNRKGCKIWSKGQTGLIPSKSIRRFLGWNYLQVTTSSLLVQYPVLLLGALRGPTEAGYFRLASTLSTTASYIEQGLNKVAYPSLSARTNKVAASRLRQQMRSWTLAAGLPGAAVVVVSIPFLPLIVPAFFGESFEPMISGLQVMFGGVAVATIFFWMSSFYFASGNVASFVKVSLVYSLILLLVGPVFAEIWGFFGLGLLVALARALSVLYLRTRVATLRLREDESEI